MKNLGNINKGGSMKRIVDLNELSLEQIQNIIDEAIAFKNGKVIDYHQKKVVANLF